MSIQTRPIVTWPGKMTPHHQRQTARYKVLPGTTRQELLRELEAISATDAFIQAAYAPDQIRLDGLPKSGAVPAHPGVILTYSVKGSPVPFDLPCDAFRDAEQNLRAIGLTLQRLRLIEETGVKTYGRQYEGFKRLPPPPAGVVAAAPLTKEQASRLVLELAGIGGELSGVLHGAALDGAYRAAAKRTHPDVNNGNDSDFKRLQQAMAVLAIQQEQKS